MVQTDGGSPLVKKCLCLGRVGNLIYDFFYLWRIETTDSDSFLVKKWYIRFASRGYTKPDVSFFTRKESLSVVSIRSLQVKKTHRSGYQPSLDTNIFLPEGSRHQFAPFCSNTKMMCWVFSQLLTPTWCIIFLLEKNQCRCSQFFSSKKMIPQVMCHPLRQTCGLTCEQAQNVGNWRQFTSSKKNMCLDMTDNLMYYFFTSGELRRLTLILL